MSDPLSPQAIEAADPSGLYGDVLDQHLQVGDALWRFESAGVNAAEAAGGLAICGVGGSAIGGDLAAGILGARALRPVRTVRAFGLPPDVGPETLVLAASYSGETEEALACFEAAGEVGSPRVVLTTGGRLADAARAAGVPVIGVPSGMQPRSAVVYAVVATLGCASACGAAPLLRDEIERGAGLLRGLAEDDSRPKELALALRGATPVFYGGGATAAVAARWKTQVNENAQAPAFFASLPEAAHNEVCAWERAEGLAAVFLEEPGQPPAIRRRIEAMAAIVAEAGAPVQRVEAPGETAFERVMSLVMIGDLVSIYLAVLDGIDPRPIEAIERLKARLG